MAWSASSDIAQRLIGLVMFIPIAVPLLLGLPYAFWGLALIALWIAVEYALLLRGGQAWSWGRHGLFAACIWSVFLYGFFASFSLFALAGVGVSAVLALILLARQTAFTLLVLSCLCTLGIIGRTDAGIYTILFLALIISAGDIGAYFVGRAIGGAKLAPSISPSKTWSGSIGGLLLSLLAGSAILVWLGAGLTTTSFLYSLAWISVVSVLAQAGDLIESRTKRQLDVKDSSQIIPGHGGVLDRFDGYLFVLPLVCITQTIGMLPPPTIWMMG